MINLNFNIDLFKSGSSLVTGIRRIIKAVLCSAKHLNAGSQVTFERAVEDYFSGKTGPGALVSIEGYLSKYILTHRPTFYSHYARRVTKHSIKPNFSNPLSGRVELEISAQPNPFPIQTIPPTAKNNQINYIYFLYQPDISSFILPLDEDKKKKQEEGEAFESLLEIKNNSKPLIVISPLPIIKEIEKIVKITGVLRTFDDDILDNFTREMTGTQRIILNNTIRPFAETIGGLCLDMRESAKVSVKSSKESMKAILYLESHMEDIQRVPGYEKVMGISFPGAFPGLHWHSRDNEPSWGLSSSEVYIAAKEFSRFAYFIETDLCNPLTYQNSLEKLHGFTELFRKNVQNFIRKEKGIEVKHKYDFIFDYSKAKLFHPEGVLVSKEVENFLNSNPEYMEDINWLRNQ